MIYFTTGLAVFLGGITLWIIIRSAVVAAIHASDRVLAVATYKALKQIEHDSNAALYHYEPLMNQASRRVN